MRTKTGNLCQAVFNQLCFRPHRSIIT